MSAGRLVAVSLMSLVLAAILGVWTVILWLFGEWKLGAAAALFAAGCAVVCWWTLEELAR